MTFEKALKALKEGRKVFRKSWADSSYVAFSETHPEILMKYRMSTDNPFGAYDFLDGGFYANDWEIHNKIQESRYDMKEVLKYALDGIESQIRCQKLYQEGAY